MASHIDYYKILGVEHDADSKAIKRAFLKKARTLHPDVSDAPDAEERFKEVNQAYSVLSDEQKRANYDRYGDPNGPAGFGAGGVDVSDIFGGFGMEDIFSSFFGGGASTGGRAVRTAGRDMGITLRISLAEAASGCTKTIAFDRLAPCDDCGGSGAASNGHTTTCSQCQGSGVVVTVQRTILGQMQSQTICPACHGSGEVIDHPCETCDGQGRTPNHETVKVEIPKGIRSGQSIKITGYGEAGIRNDASGDLIVRIDIIEDDVFQVRGNDLYCVQDISAFEAMLGCTFEIDGILPDEKVNVTVPAGSQHGDSVVVAGCGMPHQGSSDRGNVVVVLNVLIPKELSQHETEMLTKLALDRDERVNNQETTSGLFGKHTGRAASAKTSRHKK